MKIIEKKCPNCGANLSFGSDAKTAKCNYCGQEYLIEQENNKARNIKDILPEDFKLQKKVIKAFNVVRLVITIIIIIIFFSIFFLAYKQLKSNGTFGNFDNQNININDIDDKTFNIIHSTSLDKLKLYNQMPINSYKKGDYEYLGSYLYEDLSGYTLTDVYKLIYSKNNSKITIYESVSYENLKYNNKKIVVDYNGRVNINMTSLGDSFVIGYRSIEELYNKVISFKSKGNIQATNDLYNE